jgi:hypothetical protein
MERTAAASRAINAPFALVTRRLMVGEVALPAHPPSVRLELDSLVRSPKSLVVPLQVVGGDEAWPDLSADLMVSDRSPGTQLDLRARYRARPDEGFGGGLIAHRRVRGVLEDVLAVIDRGLR